MTAHTATAQANPNIAWAMFLHMKKIETDQEKNKSIR
jgi:hypothetical protein